MIFWMESDDEAPSALDATLHLAQIVSSQQQCVHHWVEDGTLWQQNFPSTVTTASLTAIHVVLMLTVTLDAASFTFLWLLIEWIRLCFFWGVSLSSVSLLQEQTEHDESRGAGVPHPSGWCNETQLMPEFVFVFTSLQRAQRWWLSGRMSSELAVPPCCQAAFNNTSFVGASSSPTLRLIKCPHTLSPEQRINHIWLCVFVCAPPQD